MSQNVTRVIVDTRAHGDTEDVAIVPELAESLAQLLERSARPLPDRTAMTYAPDLRPSMRFGEFEFTPGLRRLERCGAIVELSSRAIDILAVLTERPGEVITKRELLARVWPDVVVVEAALRVHMVALRRALGDGEEGKRLIITVPGRGYCFVGSLEPAPAAIEGGAPLPRDSRRALRLEEPGEESWSSPEVLRIKGAIAELGGDLDGAEARYRDALAIAEHRGALTSRLRAATALAALWVRQGRPAEAQAALMPVYQQFSADRPWPDLRRAAACLEACRRALAAVGGRLTS